MHLHVRIKHWVVIWIYVGVVCGAVALVNIFLRNLTATQIKLVLFFGAVFWVIGGLVCWGYEGVKIEPPPPPRPTERPEQPTPPAGEWHSASDFVLPGSRKRLLR